MPLQGLSAQTNSMRRYKAHGAGRVRVRMRGRAGAPSEPRVAKHLRDVAPSRASLHGRRGGHEGRFGPHQDTAVCFAGTYNMNNCK